MPITASTTFHNHIPPVVTGPLQIVDSEISVQAGMNQVEPIVREIGLTAIDTDLEVDGNLSAIDTSLEEETALIQIEHIIEESGSLYSHEVDITASVPMYLQVGVVPPWVNPFRFSVPMYQSQNYHKLFHPAPLYILDRLLTDSGPLIQREPTITGSDNLILIDVLGPQIFNTVPASGSTFNNPISTVSFDLIDTGGSNIVLSGTQVFVDGVQVIEAGVDVTPSGYGITSFTPVDTTFYQFEFIPENPFSPDSSITISGRSLDSTTSGNIENFSYSFNVWKTSDLSASIIGLPDTDPPYLANQSPFPGQVEVPVDTDILLSIEDQHTGVDSSSVILGIKGEVIYSGGQSQSALYPVTRVVSSGGKGFDFSIFPSNDFSFSDEIEIDVVANDSFIPPNILDTSYSFFTVTNSHLVASGLQIYEDSGYVDMEVDSSYETDITTQFHVTYLNTEGTGISLSGSSVLLNGSEISSTITQVSGSSLAYDVYFDLSPDYTDNAVLTFHVQQSGTVSGSILDRDVTTELLWGYQFCYDEDRLGKDTDFEYLVRVRDSGDAPTTSSLAKEFSTVPFDNSKLFASITGIDPPHREVSALYVSNNTFFEYGKTMQVELEVEDFAGNRLQRVWSFTIEEE